MAQFLVFGQVRTALGHVSDSLHNPDSFPPLPFRGGEKCPNVRRDQPEASIGEGYDQ